MSFSVIIPSRNVENLIPCVEALRNAEPVAEIIVIDDGVDWNAAAQSGVIGRNLAILALSPAEDPYRANPALGFAIVPGVKPFVFARNINLAIRACSEDVVLLNDDALLTTPFGFHELEEASKAHPEFGVISATTNVVGNPEQHPQDIGLREASRNLAFVCVYIPRATIDRVGLLDERFTAYGWDDNDYCRRVKMAGLELGILDDCFVDHSCLKSTFRGSARAAGNIAPGREIYRQKWGDTL